MQVYNLKFYHLLRKSIKLLLLFILSMGFIILHLSGSNAAPLLSAKDNKISSVSTYELDINDINLKNLKAIAPAPIRPGSVPMTAPLISSEEARNVLAAPLRSSVSEEPFQLDAAETDITPEIQELARGLRNDPKLIYEFVRNSIDYIPIYGSLKGATMTLLDRKGNDFDQASLMIALLRASGYTANYIYGRIHLDAGQVTNWLGIDDDINVLGDLLGSAAIPADLYISGTDNIDFVKMDHVWVKVSIGETDYVFDPSFKTYSYLSGIDLAFALGYDRTTFLNSAKSGMTEDPNYVKDINRANLRSNLTTYTGNLISYINSTIPHAGMDDVVGGRKIVTERDQSFQTTLPHEISRSFEWEDIPLSYQTTLRIQHLGIDVTLPTSEFYGKRLTILYTYDGSYHPTLALDGYIIAQGDPTYSAGYYPCYLTVDHPYAGSNGTYCDESGIVWPMTGYMYYISTGWGETGRKIIEKHRRTLEEFISQGYSSNSEAVLGETLAMIGLSWMAETSRAAVLGDRISKTITIMHHELGVVGQQDSPFMDMPMSITSIISASGDSDSSHGRWYARSGIDSAFEWGAIDQMQPISAVSTIKLLDIASEQGNKIFDADNITNYQDHVRPNLIGYTPYRLSTVESYINAGYRLILPEHGDLEDGSYTGLGFIAISPSGGMAHIIAGGLSGGYGNEPGTADGNKASSEMEDYDKPESDPKSREPIDLLTGYYLDNIIDLTIGASKVPYGLKFGRSYNSGSRLDDGPIGLGWRHNWNTGAGVASDGFRGMGDASPANAAAVITELFVSSDILQDGLPLDRLAIATLAHRWFMDNLINNMVNISTPGNTIQFVKIPDGSYVPPPGKWAQLTIQGDDSFLLTIQHGEQLDFDTQGRLTTWKDPNENTITLSYTENKLAGISNGMGRNLSLAYNQDGRISEVSDGNARTVSYTYDSAGNLLTVTDPESKINRYEYDIDGRLIKIYKPSDHVNPWVTNTYDAFDRVISQTDFAANPYSYYYSGIRTEEINPQGYSQVLYFDHWGRRILSIDPLGLETTFAYDGLGRLIKTIRPEGNGAEYAYDGSSNITQISFFPKTGSSEIPHVMHFTYEPGFNKISTATNPLGCITAYTYDSKGNLTRMEYPEVGGQIPTYNLTINARGQVERVDGPEGMNKSNTYDDTGTGDLLSSTIDQSGLNLSTSYRYDTIGNLTETTDPRGNQFIFDYDDNRRIIKEIAPTPFNYIAQFGYDFDGNPNLVEKETGDISNPWQTTSITYTLNGKRSTVTDPEGRITTYHYNEVEKLWKIFDNAGNFREFLYDPFGRAYQQIDSLSNVVEEHTYTPNGKKAYIKDANGHATIYEYDDFNRLWRITSPDSSFVEFFYDAADNITQKRTRSGDIITYQYDNLGRLILKTLPDSSTIQYTYDQLGRPSQITSNSGTIQCTYDTLGRLVSVTHPGNKTISYEYDAASNRTRLTYPDGYFLTYTYDALNRLEQILENGSITPLVQYTYDSLSRQTILTYNNGTSIDYSYSNDNRLINSDHHFNGGIASFSYGYDIVGNQTSLTTSDVSFDYTPVADADISFITNNLNQYTSVDGVSYSYDTNGNLTSDGTNAYTYDLENLLISVTTPANVVTYTYNSFGQRIGKEVNGVMTSYLYEGLHVLIEYDNNDNLVKRYIYGPGLDNPVMIKTSTGDYCYHQDSIGSVIALSDASGNRVETYAYSPFGEPNQTSAIGNTFMYSGREYEEESGLYYFRARYYSPDLGRFVSADPIGPDGGDLNLYTYCLNNPANNKDLLGLKSILAKLADQYKGMEGYEQVTEELLAVEKGWKNFGEDEDAKYPNRGIPVINTIVDWGVDMQPNCRSTFDDFTKYYSDLINNPENEFNKLDYFEFREIGIIKNNKCGNYEHVALAVVWKGTDNVVAVLDPIVTGNLGFLPIPGQLGIRKFGDSSIQSQGWFTGWNNYVNWAKTPGKTFSYGCAFTEKISNF